MAGSESAIGGRTSSDPLFGPLQSWSFRALALEQPLLAQTGPLMQINRNDGPAIHFVVKRVDLNLSHSTGPRPPRCSRTRRGRKSHPDKATHDKLNMEIIRPWQEKVKGKYTSVFRIVGVEAAGQ
jgi:hypothetical protein